MSDHLEQEVQASGPGKVRLSVRLPRTRYDGPAQPWESVGDYARKKLELYQKDGNDWILLHTTTRESHREWDEVLWNVESGGTLKTRLTNMSGMEGQFSLECSFLPPDQK